MTHLSSYLWLIVVVCTIGIGYYGAQYVRYTRKQRRLNELLRQYGPPRPSDADTDD